MFSAKPIARSFLFFLIVLISTSLSSPSVYAAAGTLNLTGSTASFSSSLTQGANIPIRTAYGPLRFDFKNGPNSYQTGMLMREGDGSVLIGPDLYAASSYTTSPSKLTVIGVVESKNPSGGFKFPDGTTQTTAATTAAASGWTDGGTSVYTTTSTDNVGIGTTAPGALLSVNKSTAPGDNIMAWFTNPDVTSGWHYNIIQANHNTASNNSRSKLVFWTNPGADASGHVQLQGWNGSAFTTGLFVEGSGNVGIGTTGPSDKLHVVGSNDSVARFDAASGYHTTVTLKRGASNKNALLAFEDENGAVAWYAGLVATDNRFKIQEGGTEVLSIKSGNVGIGTTGPNNKLEVLSTTSPQLRTAYSTSQYATTGVSSAGTVTMDAVGTTPGYYFPDRIGVGPNGTLNTNYDAYISNTNMVIDNASANAALAIDATVAGTQTTAGSNHYGIYRNLSFNGSGAGYSNSMIGDINYLDNNVTTIGGNSSFTNHYNWLRNQAAVNFSGAWRNNYNEFKNASTGTMTTVMNDDNRMVNSSTGVITSAYNYYTIGSNSAAGTITNLYGLYADSPVNASGTITSAYGVFVKDQSVGTNTSAYGVYIEDQAGAVTNNYGIYSAGTTNKNYFGGSVGIGTTAPGALLQIGTAGSTTGVIRLTGSTSGYVEISSRAIGGSWTMNLPQGVGTAGYQLTDAAGNGNTSWAAAGSVRSMKNISGLFGNPNDALTTLLDTNVYRFHYKPEMGTGDSTTEYVGVMADEAPWAVHYNGTVVNPVNTLGYMVLGIQALDNKISALGVPELSNVIKEQRDEIDQLKARLEKLEKLVNAGSNR